jgi:hypothetical protein
MARANASGRALQPRESALLYSAQHSYVVMMLEVIGRLMVAASARDPELQRELAGFPDNLTFGFSVLGASAKLRLRWRGGLLSRLSGDHPAGLEVTFKHIGHAFMVLSFQESSAQAYANQRLVMQGDPALAVRFTRCLNRVQGVTLPRFVAARALKAVPSLSVGDKLSLNARLWAGVARDLARRSPA